MTAPVMGSVMRRHQVLAAFISRAADSWSMGPAPSSVGTGAPGANSAVATDAGPTLSAAGPLLPAPAAPVAPVAPLGPASPGLPVPLVGVVFVVVGPAGVPGSMVAGIAT